MDERDVRILKAVEDLETTSTEAVSEATDIPISTVHYRLNNLEADGVIRNDRLDVDLDAVGLGVTVLVEVFMTHERAHDGLGERIADIEGVTNVFFTMGETDFIALARLPDSDAVERLISDFEGIDEVARTTSTFVIDRVLDSPNALAQYDEATLVATLADE